MNDKVEFEKLVDTLSSKDTKKHIYIFSLNHESIYYLSGPELYSIRRFTSRHFHKMSYYE